MYVRGERPPAFAELAIGHILDPELKEEAKKRIKNKPKLNLTPKVIVATNKAEFEYLMTQITGESGNVLYFKHTPGIQYQTEIKSK